MSGSMYAAISGLNASQAMLGVVSQNIANVDTVGYKASSISFAQSLMQTLSGGSAPTAASGGTNPMQVAAGGAVTTGGIDINTSEGTLQSTGINTNLAIQGKGMFIIQTPQGTSYSRAGNFTIDAAGNLVTPQGGKVMGWTAAQVRSGTQTATNIGPVTVPPNTSMAPKASTTIGLNGNLDSVLPSGSTGTSTTVDIPVTLYDSLGNPQQVTLAFTGPTATSAGGTSWQVGYYKGSTATGTPTSLGTLAFDANGNVTTWPTGTIAFTPTDGAAALSVQLSQAKSQVTGYAASSSLTASANGNAPGALVNFTVGANGVLSGTFSNGLTQSIGQVGLANFANPAGLLNAGQNLWQQSPNSGVPQIGQAASGAFGSLAAGTLEGSNVSLANEFVNMVIAQQGYQANAKVISVSQALRTTLTNAIAP